MVLPLFATRFAAHAEGIRVSFIQPRLFYLINNVLREIYIIQTYMDEMYKHVFRVCAIWDTQAFNWCTIVILNIKPFCSDVCGDHRRPQSLAEICRNKGICCCFRAVAARENIRGSSYFVNPECDITTVCQHVRCMYWWQMSLFHRSIPLVNIIWSAWEIH